ncbi:hypothetical protein JCM5353_004999 [Sporobolomyces roseus]
MVESLAVLLLNAEGDKFNTSFLNDGIKGGETAAELVYTLAKEKVEIDNSRDGDTKLIVYLVSNAHNVTMNSNKNQAFLKGFASTSNPCFVVEPIKVDGTSSASIRILELLKTYIPLKSVSTILLGALHTTDLYSYLKTLPSQYQAKVTLVSTITVAPPYRVLVDSGTVAAWRGLERLFGGMSELPDLSTLSINDSPRAPVRIDEAPLEEEAPESPSEEMIARLIWESSGFERSEEDDSSEEWEIASPRSTRKPQNGNVDNSSAPGDRSYSSAARAASSINQVVGASRAAQQAKPGATSQPRSPRRERGGRQKAFSKTSGASRRRAQRERVAAEARREENQARLRELESIGEVSPYPAWRPPRITFDEPHPCINQYLSKDKCTDRNCPYSHDYPFTEEEKRLYRPFIKSMICTKFLHGQCKKGEDCLKGHRCPYTVKGCIFKEKCYYKTQGLPHSSPS